MEQQHRGRAQINEVGMMNEPFIQSILGWKNKDLCVSRSLGNRLIGQGNVISVLRMSPFQWQEGIPSYESAYM